MVLSFVIANLQSDKPSILFCKFFQESNVHLNCLGSDTDLGVETESRSEWRRRSRRDQITKVVDKLHSIYQFQATTNPKSFDYDLQVLNNDDTDQVFDVFSFRMTKDELFLSDLRVFWLSVHGFGLAFVCLPTENRLQTEITLRILTHQLHETLRFVLQPNVILLKPEKVDIVVSKFVPFGNIILMNHRLIRQLERETEDLLKAL